jgi:uncharacterized phage protein (TIGR01671 family)
MDVVTGYWWEEHGFDSEDLAKTNHHVLMQYTGQKDKNHKEIYEGDILRDKQEVYLVVFQRGSFVALPKNYEPARENEKELRDWFSYDAHHIEVVGNIYENTELIEK